MQLSVVPCIEHFKNNKEFDSKKNLNKIIGNEMNEFLLCFAKISVQVSLNWNNQITMD